MFARKVTKPQTPANEEQTTNLAHQHSAFAARAFRSGGAGQAPEVSPTARPPTQRLSGDFSEVSILAPKFGKAADRTNHEVPGDILGALGPSAPAGSHERVVAWVRANQNRGEALAARFARPIGAWLGIDTSPVRIHTDAFADQAATRLEANAFTVGKDVFFRRGSYALHRADGLLRLAHELAHTAQQRDTGRSAPARTDALECQADERVRSGRAAPGGELVGPTILREPTFPRRATGSAMIREVERVLTLKRDPASKNETTRMWSNVASNFGDVTAGSIARRIWTNLFLRHFVEPESRPGVESQFPRYMYSQSFGWIDAQHFFGFIDYAEQHYQKTGDRQKAFDAATAQGVKIEADQQTVRDYIVAGQSPDPGPARLMQVRPPNTPLFRAPQTTYGERLHADGQTGQAHGSAATRDDTRPAPRGGKLSRPERSRVNGPGVAVRRPGQSDARGQVALTPPAPESRPVQEPALSVEAHARRRN